MHAMLINFTSNFTKIFQREQRFYCVFSSQFNGYCQKIILRLTHLLLNGLKIVI